ncbi:MAG: hypothetical protein V1870_00690 [Candidatus Aenigmatarchaeota archaeon]
MLSRRSCSDEDREFVYSIMKENMEGYFNRNTPEKWSDDKFHKGFDPDRIKILEIDGCSIGFYDVEDVYANESFLYIHNVQIKKGKRGVGADINRMLDEEAKTRNLTVIRGKVFCDNIRSIRFCEYMGYLVVSDSSLEEENSIWIEKRLGI